MQFKKTKHVIIVNFKMFRSKYAKVLLKLMGQFGEFDDHQSIDFFYIYESINMYILFYYKMVTKRANYGESI
jgi:hypothetical protein